VLRREENLGAAAIDLTPDDLARIGAVLAPVDVQGDRYSPVHAARLGK
jgi:hypothetical protein